MDELLNVISTLVGDMPVSEQISIALSNHSHEKYVTRDEMIVLAQKINKLIELVGDTPVSEQIQNAIKNIP